MTLSNNKIIIEAKDYIDGLLLSDGHVSCISAFTGRYSQICKYKSWLDKIQSKFYECDIICKVDNGRIRHGFKEGGSFSYTLYTNSYVEFKDMRERWYRKEYEFNIYINSRWWHKDKDGEWYIWEKIIPKDINLSPDCIANWYLGDGSIYRPKRENNYQIVLATNGFLRNDVIFLSELLLERLDIKNHVTKRGEIKILQKDSVDVFISYIYDYKIDCYTYKFPEELMLYY